MSNKLSVSRAAISSVKRPSDILEMEAVRKNWITSLAKTSGITEEKAAMKFELEKILFNKITSDKKFDKVTDNFSYYVAFFELMLSGVSLQEGQGYMIPMGEQCTFQVGWQGRREQLMQNPIVKYAHEPEIVYHGDDFEYELAPVKRVIRHKRTENTDESERLHVYMIIDMVDAPPELFILSSTRVYQIRDKYSKTYKDYVRKIKSNEWKDWMDLPMWVSDEDQAFRKTLVKHAYKAVPRTGKQKQTDQMLSDRLKAKGVDSDLIDPDEMKDEEDIDYTQYTMVEGDDRPAEGERATVNTATGEITEPEDKKPAQPDDKSKKMF